MRNRLLILPFIKVLHPEKGFDILLNRAGICSAITACGGHDFTPHPSARAYCIRSLIAALHSQLRDRLANEIRDHEGTVPEGANFTSWFAGRDYLFADGAYHLDTSHLASIVQYALELEACPEIALARELTAYGERLPDVFRHEGDPPFEDSYRDYRALLEVIDGIDIDENLARFAAKIEPALADDNSFPAQIYVNLLLRADMPVDAREAAKRYLAQVPQVAACPSVYDLCMQQGDYIGLAEVAQQRGDGVSFLAALIAQRAVDHPI